MHPVVRAAVVLATAGGLLVGGRAALKAAPGQNVPPAKPTPAQLAQLNGRLAAQAAQEEQALAQLQQQEQQLESTVADLQQQAAAYRQQLAEMEGQLQGGRLSGDDFGRRYR
jgi:chromosome segregation ATPase